MPSEHKPTHCSIPNIRLSVLMFRFIFRLLNRRVLFITWSIRGMNVGLPNELDGKDRNIEKAAEWGFYYLAIFQCRWNAKCAIFWIESAIVRLQK